MRIFVPIEDASVDNETGALMPYRYGLTCAHELRGELVLRDGVWREREAMNLDVLSLHSISDGSSFRRPEPLPASSTAQR